MILTTPALARGFRQAERWLIVWRVEAHISAISFGWHAAILPVWNRHRPRIERSPRQTLLRSTRWVIIPARSPTLRGADRGAQRAVRISLPSLSVVVLRGFSCRYCSTCQRRIRMLSGSAWRTRQVQDIVKGGLR